MNYEEKYNQTIESIKRIYEQADSFVKELMEKEFIELRKSDDEMIRKSLIAMLSQDKDLHSKEIAWLEKQAEQKPCMIQWKGDNLKEVINFTGKNRNFDKWFTSFEEFEKYVHEHNGIFKIFNEDGSHYEVPVGAWIVKTPDGYNVPSKARYEQKGYDQRYIADVFEQVGLAKIARELANDNLTNALQSAMIELSKGQGEQKPVEWDYPYGEDETVDKLMAIAECLEMDGDCLFNGYTGTECGKFLRDLARKQVECKPVDKVEPKFRVGDKIRRKIPRQYDKDMQVVRVESNYYLCNHLGKFSSETISFSEESNYELAEQNPSWSEEDKEMLDAVIADIQFTQKAHNHEVNQVVYEREIDWLKSLRPQNRWKPSEYDISLLEEIARNIRNDVRPFCSEVSSLEDLIKNIKTLLL